jgi:predicted lactoylglutathione lyase
VAFWIAGGAPTSSVHLAFRGSSRAKVTLFFEAALASGGKDNGKPGPRPDYSKEYYAAFVIDPDGNNVEAVTFSAK